MFGKTVTTFELAMTMSFLSHVESQFRREKLGYTKNKVTKTSVIQFSEV